VAFVHLDGLVVEVGSGMSTAAVLRLRVQAADHLGASIS
jgi:hypothetical protein